MSRTLRDERMRTPVRSLWVRVLEGPDEGAERRDVSDTLTIGTAAGNDLLITDRTVSRYHVELTRRPDGIAVRDLSSTNGTRVGTTKIESAIVAGGTVLEIGRTRIQIADGSDFEVEVLQRGWLSGLVGTTTAMRRVLAQAQRIAPSQTSVLLLGESGTGKEVLARAIHDLSSRAKRGLVTVDCGSLAPNLVASELFGHEKGAFTGADRKRIGAFERAHGGTLFLDEVGELPEALQANLLGALERGRFTRLGGHEEVQVDARVIAATHRDLRVDVNEGRFRLDLYYRLAAVRVVVPPLRERLEDIPHLVEQFLGRAGCDVPADQILNTANLARLNAHSWPGNVRELRNWVEATLAMGEAAELESGIGPTSGRRASDETDDTIASVLEDAYSDARRTVLSEFERRFIEQLLRRAGGNISKAARLARMDRSHLSDLVRKHGLK